MVSTEEHSPEHAFIHIPKTGGTSIEHGLLADGHHSDYGFKQFNEWNWRCGFFKTPEYRRKHVYLWTLVQAMGMDWCNRIFLFTLVRNPWARYVSQYHFRRAVRHGDKDPERIQSLTFEEWTRIRIEEESPRLNSGFRQSSWLEFDGEIGDCVDYIGRTETINEDWQAILKQLGRDSATELPWKLKMSYNRDYRTFYTPELRDLVGEFAHKDCVRFGYDFDGITGPGTARVGQLRNERRRDNQEPEAESAGIADSTG